MTNCEKIHRGLISLENEPRIQKTHPKLGIMTIYPNLGVYLIHNYNRRYRKI